MWIMTHFGYVPVSVLTSPLSQKFMIFVDHLPKPSTLFSRATTSGIGTYVRPFVGCLLSISNGNGSLSSSPCVRCSFFSSSGITFFLSRRLRLARLSEDEVRLTVAL